MRTLRSNFISILSLALVICFISASVILNSRNQSDDSDIISNGNGGVQNITNNVIEITGATSDVALAASSGLRSAVSVYCTFTSSYGGSYPWMPNGYKQTYYSAGSGVIYDVDEKGNAFIITNYHVVYDSDSSTSDRISDEIYVYLYGMENEQYAIPTEFIGGSSNYDIAILRVNENEVLKNAYASGTVAAATFADSDKIHAGDIAIAIGNPTSSSDLGGISVTKGIVSVDSEYITMTAADERSEVSYRLIRVDTPINSGNSGGGLFNGKGELIGIVNAKISTSSIENIGYAIPSNVARAIADNIIDYCYKDSYSGVMRCILGITIQVSALNTNYNTETGLLEKSEQISVAEVSSKSVADGKILPGDIIKSITIGDKTVTVTRQHHLIDTMLDVRVGSVISIVVERNGAKNVISISIDESCLTQY